MFVFDRSALAVLLPLALLAGAVFMSHRDAAGAADAGRSATRARPGSHGRGQLALEVTRQLGNRREVEQLGQVHQAGIDPVDLLVDLDELE